MIVLTKSFLHVKVFIYLTKNTVAVIIKVEIWCKMTSSCKWWSEREKNVKMSNMLNIKMKSWMLTMNTKLYAWKKNHMEVLLFYSLPNATDVIACSPITGCEFLCENSEICITFSKIVTICGVMTVFIGNQKYFRNKGNKIVVLKMSGIFNCLVATTEHNNCVWCSFVYMWNDVHTLSK